MACIIITVTDSPSGNPQIDVRMNSFPEMPTVVDDGTPAQIVAWVMMDMLETLSKKQDAELPEMSIKNGCV